MRRIRVVPLLDSPIIPIAGQPADAPHANINGPSLIRVPPWVTRPLGAYYLYFADHKGSSIKLAFADRLAGPWSTYERGVLQLSRTPFLKHAPAIPETVDRERLGVSRAPGVPSPLSDCTIPHIASPDVIADEPSRTIRLYYHGLDAFARQVSRVAVSSDGLHFEARDEIISPSYLRMFAHAGGWYGIAMPGGLFRSHSGIDSFEKGPTLFSPDMRHAGVWKRGDTLWVFWTRVGDAPERILLSTIDLRDDWTRWEESEPEEVYRATRSWEGAGEPIEPSVRSSVDHAVNQLRDPFVLVDVDDVWVAVSGLRRADGRLVARRSGSSTPERHPDRSRMADAGFDSRSILGRGVPRDFGPRGSRTGGPSGRSRLACVDRGCRRGRDHSPHPNHRVGLPG